MAPAMKFAALCIAAAALSTAHHAAHAQAWPAKPIRLVVSYAAGGPADVITRLVAKGKITLE